MSGQYLQVGDDWLETTGTVLSSLFRYSHLTDIQDDFSDQSRYLMTFTYQVAGETYTGEFAEFEARVEGSIFALKYNPEKPEQNSMSLYPEPLYTRIVRWICLAIVAAILLYLAEHFGWQNEFD